MEDGRVKAQKKIINGLLRHLMANDDWDLSMLNDIRFYCGEKPDRDDLLFDYMEELQEKRRTIHFDRITRFGDIDIHSKQFARTLSAVVRMNEHMKLFPMLDYYHRHGVFCRFVRIPSLDDIKKRRGLTENEEYRILNGISGNSSPVGLDSRASAQLELVYGGMYDEFIKGTFGSLDTVIGIGNIPFLEEIHKEGVNVFDGCRMTTDAPDEYDNKAFILGPCTIGGPFLTDDDTIPSNIQRMFNSRSGGGTLVRNLGSCGFFRGYREKLVSLSIDNRDIIIVVDYVDPGTDTSSIDDISLELLDYYGQETEVFFDTPGHINAKGAKGIAKYIYEHIADKINDVQKRDRVVIQRPSLILSDEDKRNIESWISKQSAVAEGVTGSIIMNANPFTLGHRYLVERAAAECDRVYVFVVEEDRSYFSYADRFNMVRAGCADLENVVVTGSGTYILSYDTMPEYFEKEKIQERDVSACNDLTLFGVVIAPALGISRRYIGEEPNDNITRQYNASMHRILGDFGIEVIEIPRKKHGNREISASTVRELIIKENRNALRDIVPDTTYDYIFNNMDDDGR